MIAIIWAVISTILLGISVFGNFRAEKKITLYEDFIRMTRRGITATITKMKIVDERGAFEADDEVGVAFKTLKNIVDELNVFLEDTIVNEETPTEKETPRINSA
jgi:hypothetical protein